MQYDSASTVVLKAVAEAEPSVLIRVLQLVEAHNLLRRARLMHMERLRNLFTEHPHSVGETYSRHLTTAWRFAGSMLLGSAACAVHGLLPFLFERTASARIGRLHERMVLHRSVRCETPADSAER